MDGSNPKAIAKFFVPKIPFILKTAVFHSLWLSSTSTKWDLRSELTIKIIRHMLEPSHPSPISKIQHMMNKDPGVKGRIWISRVTAPAPAEDDVRQLLFKTIDEMKEGAEAYAKPESVSVEAEWTGSRANVPHDEPEPATSEKEKYVHLMNEVKSDVTVLYFHGGAYFLLDPATHRATTVKLAKLTKGRVYSVRYRLAPQNPFPTALLDALNSYLYLLYPPEGSFHAPVPASKIVFAGDSAGGNLSLVLLQTLLQIHRSAPAGTTPSVLFNGQQVALPLPAGLALNSPWLDMTRCMPSLEHNAQYDYLPPPSRSAKAQYAPDHLWPTDPPRADLYCEGSALCHPLVSPLAAKDWAGAPPIFICCGEEMLADEDRVFAARLAKQGVRVVWEQFEAMPHCFAMVLQGLEGGRLCVSDWASFIKTVVEEPEKLKTEGVFVAAKSLVRHQVDVEALAPMSEEEVKERMREAKERMCRGVEQEGKAQPML